MEFWGAEVKVGQSVKVDPREDEACIHLSQVALGESKKDKGEATVVYAKVGDQKFVLGTLYRDKIPQLAVELVMDKEFELSHTSKTASVHFLGYKAFYPESDEEFSDTEDEDQFLPPIPETVKTETKAEDKKASQSKKPVAKADAPAKKQVKVAEPKKEEEEDSDDDSGDDDDSESSDAEMEEAGSDSGDDDDSDEDDDEEETPTPKKKVDQGKKRTNESASKTPVPSKKSKNATPEKTDGKKGGHSLTPHPKKGGKTPNSEAKDTPKSGGQFSCKSCSKSFNSDSGFQQHNKAKHGQS